MIQWMLAIWSLVPLPFLNIACISQSSSFINCWSLAWRIEHYLASMWNECNCTGVWTFSGIVALVKLNKKKERTQIINIRNQRGGITTGPIDISSVTQSCPTLCDPMNCSTLGLPVHHQLLESTQTHVHWVSGSIQPSHPLSFPSSLTLNLSQLQGLFQWVNSLHQVAKVLEFRLQHQSFQ